MRHNTVISFAVVTTLLMFIAATASAQPTPAQPVTKLFNGWSISPAGKVAPLEHLEAIAPLPAPTGSVNMTADLPLKMIVSPDGKLLLAACAGYNATGLAVFDLASSKLIQFLPEPEVFNGLAFSRDGKKVYLSGGDSGKIYVFGYNAGKLSLGTPIAPVTKPAAASASNSAAHRRRLSRSDVRSESLTCNPASFWRALRYTRRPAPLRGQRSR